MIYIPLFMSMLLY